MGTVKRAICAECVFCICALARSSTANTQLFVQVRAEATIVWQGESVVLVKIRLGPGIHATVWADDSCGTPPVNGQVIDASGIYTITLVGIKGTGKANVCLSSTDGSLRTFLPALGK
jgi:hypothetical protein